MSAVVVYGIANCDTVKKARRWLDAHGVEHRFHDLRRDGAPASLVAGWLAAVPAQTLLNRQSATWRALGEADRAMAETPEGAVQLLCAHPTLIRRPVVDGPGGLTVGFAPERFTVHRPA